jgi:guanine deaminase
MRIRGPILNPKRNDRVDFIADGLLVGDEKGRITYVGPYNGEANFDRASGVICPAFFDNHIHIPQHPIRGKFMEGIGANPPEGRLIAGLNRNVFPAEARCADPTYTRQVVEAFFQDTLSKGVIGGAAYMTVHTPAARIALEMLPKTWSVGPVLMNQNCPEYLRTDESTWQRDVESLANDFGGRVIVTDRFAVAVSSELRRQAVALAKRLGLRMQTHLNEQIAEKQFVEHVLYPDAGTYVDVYDRDGLLDCSPILAHCVRMCMGEFQWVSWHPGCEIAHCPTSNVLLGSGIMPLEQLEQNGIDFAICTDVGASPTTSILCEMAMFLLVHHDSKSGWANAEQALYRTTLGAARMMGSHEDVGSFEVGKAMTFIEIDCDMSGIQKLSAEQVIRQRALETVQPTSSVARVLQKLRDTGLDAGPELTLLEGEVAATMQRLDRKVRRVVVDGTGRFSHDQRR